VAHPRKHRRRSHGSQGTPLQHPVGRRRGHRRRFPQAHAAAAGRLPSWPAADHPSPDALVPAPLPGTARHLPVASGRRLPQVQGDKPKKQRFASYAIGYFHIDIDEVSTAEGKLRMFVAIDPTSKFAFVRLVESAGKMQAAQFLRELIQAVPYRIHTVLTDNAIQFTNRVRDICDSQHVFDRVCNEHGIEHRLTKVNHPWTNGQVERMNRTIKDATVKRYHYHSHEQFRTHSHLFVDAYNHARRLKTLRGLTPAESIHQTWTKTQTVQA
jgi:transposase InsO family protein